MIESIRSIVARSVDQIVLLLLIGVSLLWVAQATTDKAIALIQAEQVTDKAMNEKILSMSETLIRIETKVTINGDNLDFRLNKLEDKVGEHQSEHLKRL